MALPNFLIIGDIKAGSTSLYYYLRQHPDVFMPTGMKELRYFSFDPKDPYQQTAKSTRVRTLAEYEKWFRGSEDATAIGESSPNYLRSPSAAQKIKRELRNPKLIVSLRNPVDRLYSMYLMDARTGRKVRSFEETALSEDCTWVKGNFVGNDLKRYFKLFPRDQIKVILFDDLKRSPESTAKELFRFLAVDDDFVPDVSVMNSGGIPKSRMAFSTLLYAKRILKRAGLSNSGLRKRWSDLRNRMLHKPPLDPITRAKVLEVFRDDIMQTQNLIEKDLSHWLT